MERKYIHVSLDIVERFVPRIPGQRIPGEDGTIPRICVSNRLLDCINAMPSGPEALQSMEPVSYTHLDVYKRQLQLKQECQRRFEALHGHDTFMEVFGRNYLEV